MVNTGLDDLWTDGQLADIPLLMLFYAGAGNTMPLARGIEAAQQKTRDGLVKAD
jgi:hypothetical protein